MLSDYDDPMSPSNLVQFVPRTVTTGPDEVAPQTTSWQTLFNHNNSDADCQILLEFHIWVRYGSLGAAKL